MSNYGYSIILFFSCNKRETSGIIFNKEKEQVLNNKIKDSCIKMNDSAVININEFYFEQEDKLLIKAEELLKKAIDCDNKYLKAYNNLLTIYDINNDIKSSLDLLNELIKINPQGNNWIFKKGVVLQKKGLDSSKFYLEKSLKYFLEYDLKNPNNLDNSLNILLAKKYLNDTSVQKKHIASLKKKYPDKLELISSFEQILIS